MSCTTYNAAITTTAYPERRLCFRPLRPVKVPLQSRKKLKKEIAVSKRKEEIARDGRACEEQLEDFDFFRQIVWRDYDTKRFCETRGLCCHCGNKFGGEYDLINHLKKNKFCGSWDCTIYKYKLPDMKVKIHAIFIYDSICDSCGKEFDCLKDVSSHKANTECGEKCPELIMSRELNLSTYWKTCSWFSSYKFHSFKKYKLEG